ncbi:MAG: DUF5703 family protein [Candidatus Nanopelagicales bacterium]|nr:DUF5703 family protein [Candidatus Nanopelagicales bacterium]
MSSVWEFREMSFHRDAKRSDVKNYLTSMAEIERWELDRVHISRDGRRSIRLRRKIYHLQRTG